MNDQTKKKPLDPVPLVEKLCEISAGDLENLCDATDAAIEGGGGFGWLKLPARDVMERYWRGVVAMPARSLFVARLDGMICGTCQLVMPPINNEAQAHGVQLTTNFVAPWARGHGLANGLITESCKFAANEGYSVVNLDVRETMEGAIKLYEKHGFVRCGMHPHYAVVDGAPVAGYYYYKVVNPKT